jgi:acetyl esterase/lipase
MTLLASFFLVLVLVLLSVHAWLGRGEDLSVHDHPVEAGASESFSRAGGPSDGHRGVVARIESFQPEVEGLSTGEMIRWVRRFMDDMPSGKRFDSEFHPVESDGLRGEWILAPGADPMRRVLYLHGGAFFAGSPLSHRAATDRFSVLARAAVLALDYRLLPEHSRRAGIGDCQVAYRWLLENGPSGRAPLERLFLGGDSAGGNLALMLSAWSRDAGLRRPDAVVAFSPVTDSMYTAPSLRANADTDLLVKPLSGPLLRVPPPLMRWVTTSINRMRPGNPLISPVRGGLAGLPPTLVQVSDSEMLHDDARRYVNKARKAGSDMRLQTWSGLLHAWPLFYPEASEAAEAWQRVGAFLEAVEQGKT